MEQKKTDRRIAKTKKAIYRAFAELLSEKNINDITIKDIADRADRTDAAHGTHGTGQSPGAARADDRFC